MEIQPSASAPILLATERLDTARELATEKAANPSPRPVEDVVELSAAAKQLAAGSA